MESEKPRHWKSMLDPGLFLGPQDFITEREVTIYDVERKQVGTDSDASQRAVMYFTKANGEQTDRGWPVPKTVMYALSVELGTDVNGWRGKKIKLRATHCMSFGSIDECVRPVLSGETMAKVYAWLKKRKVSTATWEKKS